MIVLMLERVPSGLRGELSRWMIEPRPGVFVGNLSAAVRERLWEKANEDADTGAGIMIHSTNTEQGFTIRTFGDPSRNVVDVDGLWLIKKNKLPS
ncbi:MAG TPA: type I-E CRISPR-associated endoribonuclease Cas2e [Armatimonadota bacterium]|nr:type I-E CRISPR-associated endoribonuclease Cas2e [Armatimonadota bacterium]HPP76509.1 type I-E CRISPR-associated endoribonuclease Cas2e [Armatimonadota bacterium]